MLRMSTLQRFVLPFTLMLALLFASMAGAATLTPDKDSITVGEAVYVKLDSGSAFAVRWKVSAQLQILSSDSDGATVKGVSVGTGTVNAKWLLGKKSASIKVTAAPGKPATSTASEPASSGTRAGAGISNPDMRRIGDLLNRYKDSLGPLGERFSRQDAATEDRKPQLDSGDQARMINTAEAFFRDLGGMGYGLKDLQRFRNDFMAAGPGGSPLFPGQGNWDRAFLGTERALMMGRAIQVQQLWMETLHETFRENPDAAVFGEIDIGSWVKMQLSGLGFPADIDFSSVSIDPALNRYLVDKFEGKLKQHTSLDMVQADALLTAHGQASPDVFIGNWGKTFAELDMLKRSKWKVLKPVFVNGELVRIDMVEKPGAQLFWEVAFRKLEAGRFAEADFPKMDLYKEPMLSLEMLRHGIHDIEHGPYSRGQQLIKMLKYAERSYFMNKKAVTEFWLDPYESNDPMLANMADKVIKNKNDPAAVADLLRGLAGEEITEVNVDTVTGRLLERAKIAMHDNAARALAFRLDKIARIDNEDTRQAELDGLWHDLETEVRTYQDSVGHPPEVMVRALELTKAVQEGKLPPSELEAKAKELHQLLNEAYKLPNSVVDRIMVSDAYIKVRNMLRQLGWIEAQVDKFVETAKKKYPRGAQVADAVKQLNDQLNKTTAGSGLLKATDWADNAFTVYEAYMGGGDPNAAMWNASMAMGRIGLQEAFPSLAIPLSIYDGFKTGSPKPVAMAVAFYYFPFAGQTYMVSQQLQRVDVAMRDAEFYNSLGKMMAVTDFDSDGRIIRFHLMQATGKQELDSADILPGNRQAVVDLFSRPDGTFHTAPNFRYWASLVPKQDDRFGLYENKLEKLRRFFAYSDDVRYATLMLENFKAQTDKLPQDKYTPERQAALERMEQQLQAAVWVAMADMLESSAKSVQSPALEAKVKKLEDDLSLADADLGQDKGLLSRIKWEIRQNSSLWTGENPYAVGVVYDKYIQAYERVKALRNEIILTLWNTGFGVNYTAAQGKPMKILLLGGKSGAPQLTGEMEADVALAEKILASHRQRGDKIRTDLENALGRPIDASRDRSHLTALGQLGFEWEHLLDDCPDRLGYQGSPEVQAALKDRQDKYKAYLAKLAEGRPRVFIEGGNQVETGKPVNLKARAENIDAKALKNVQYTWREEGMRGKLQAKGASASFSSSAPGNFKIRVELQQSGKTSAINLAEAYQEIKVADAARISLAINGPSSGEVGKTLAFTGVVNAPDEARNALRMEWSADGRRLGNGTSATFSSQQAGSHRISLAAYQKESNGKETQVAGADQSVTLTAKDDKQGKPSDQGNPDAITDAKTGLNKPGPVKQGAGGSASGQFPGEPFNGMQISYNFSGCSLPEMKDSPGFTTSRGYKGRLGSGSMTVSGSARMGAGYGASLSVSVSAGGEHKEYSTYIKSGFPGYNTATFNLTIPIPATATSGGFRIGMAGEYNAGGRGLVVSGSCSADGPEGATPKGTDELNVDLSGPSAPVPLGQEAEVSASAKGGRFPYSYAWSGATGSGERAKAKITRPGSQQVTVTVSDSEGKRAGANLTIKVAPLKLELAGLPNQAYYGSRSQLQVKGLPNFQPTPGADPCAGREYKGSNPYDECLQIRNIQTVQSALPSDLPPPPEIRPTDVRAAAAPTRASPEAREGAYRFVWQSEPGLTFDPATSSDGNTTFTYDRMGQVKVWCEVAQLIEGAWQTIGETDQKTVNVVAPAFSIGFTPPNGQGKIGQDVRAKVVAKPEVPAKLIDYRWLDPTSHMEYTDNASEIGFKVKDAKPIALNALARVPHYGDEIANITGSYTGVAYDVKIGPPKARGPQLQVWVCDTQLGNAKNCGMKDIPQGQFTTFQDITLQAEVTPAPASPRYRWTVDPSGSCGQPGSGSELRLNCSNTGSYTVHLQVHDADNILLGQADGAVSVAVSDNDVRQAPKSKEAWNKMQQAKQNASDGQLDLAITLAAAAAGLDPKNTEANDLGKRWSDERNTVRQQVDRANKALQNNKPGDAQKEIDAAKKLQPKYPPVLDADKQIADKRKNIAQTTATKPGVATTTAKITTTGSAQPIDLSSVGGQKAAAHVAKGVSIDDSSWIRFKSTDENRRSLDIPVPTPTRAAAIAVVSNLDDATYVEQGQTIARIIVTKDTGTEVLEIQAGVHSSEWNYGVGPKHKRVDSADIGDNRFLVVLPLARPGVVKAIRVEYVETNAPKWAGHAPGFCLRGVSLVANTQGIALAPSGVPATMTATATATANLARGKPASQSSTTQWSNSNDAQGAVDGVINGSFGFHTNNEANPWWQVDLGGQASIDEVRLYNRQDCCAERARTVQIMLSDDGRQWRTVYRHGGSVFGGKDGKALKAPLNGATARFVRLQLNEANWFYLDEVEVYGRMAGDQAAQTSQATSTGQGGASLSLGKTSYMPGESIQVRFTAPASWPNNAWVGIIPSSIPHGNERQNDNHDVSFQYLDKRASGSLTFTAPAAGDWDFRLHVTDDNGKEYASVSFRVGTAPVDGGRDYTGYTPPAVTSGAPATSTPATTPAGQASVSFYNGNIGGVSNGPSQPTTFTFNEARVVTLIQDYHWNSARGDTPGSIAVRDASGRIYGPWQAAGSPGQGGVPNAYWTAKPNATLPADTYTVIDSNPASWSHNSQSGYRGFTRVESYPGDLGESAPAATTGKPDGVSKQVDDLFDAVKSLKGLFRK